MSRCLRFEVWTLVAFLVWAAPAGAQAPATPPASPSVLPAPAAPKVLGLDEALRIADAQAPALHEAVSQERLTAAQANQARSGLLPSLTGTASYERTTANFAPRPGSVPTSLVSSRSPSFNTYNYYQFGLTLDQLIYDFGQSTKQLEAARATAAAARSSTESAQVQLHQSVRKVYFQARAAKALLQVAQETLDNQRRHLQQIQAFVSAGTRPSIDLAQARADEANARVQVINAQNAYATARVQLATTMGYDAPATFDVGDQRLGPVAGESRSAEALLQTALENRPQVESLRRQVTATELSVRAAQGAYGPALYASTGVSEIGSGLHNFAWNWNAGMSLNWPIVRGGLTRAQVDEARARVQNAEAQLEALRQEVRLEVEQACLGIAAAVAALEAAEEATTAAQEQLRLAEGRYQSGSGNIIELSDAQLAATNAEAQQVQAQYNLASARADLLAALGRS